MWEIIHTCAGALGLHNIMYPGVNRSPLMPMGNNSHNIIYICALREHDMIHTGVKPFTCDTCGTLFVTTGGFKVHKITYTHCVNHYARIK